MTLDLIIEAVIGIARSLMVGLLIWAFVGFSMEIIEKQYGHQDDRTAETGESLMISEDIIPQKKGEGKHERNDRLQSA